MTKDAPGAVLCSVECNWGAFYTQAVKNVIDGTWVFGEQVDNYFGDRFETYVIKGERGSGCICLNGAAARKVQVGDVVIIMSYALMDFEEAKTFMPKVAFPDADNRIVK